MKTRAILFASAILLGIAALVGTQIGQGAGPSARAHVAEIASDSAMLPATATATATPTLADTATPVATETPFPDTATPEPPTATSYPSNITAICEDGSYSYSAHRRGTCSHHGGVYMWVNYPPS